MVEGGSSRLQTRVGSWRGPVDPDSSGAMHVEAGSDPVLSRVGTSLSGTVLTSRAGSQEGEPLTELATGTELPRLSDSLLHQVRARAWMECDVVSAECATVRGWSTVKVHESGKEAEDSVRGRKRATVEGDS
eukprot:2066053-Rhodomonas_salina.1